MKQLQARGNNLQKTIVVLDEASMVGSQTMHHLVQCITARKARLWLSGDKAQLSGIEHGNLFSVAQAFQMNTAHMDELLRQQEPALRQAVEYSLIKDHQSALKHLRHIHVIEDKNERLQKCAQLYCQVSANLRRDYLLIIPSHRDREIIHGFIRAHMQDEGSLKGAAIEQTSLTSRALTRAQMHHAAAYTPGDVIRFNRDARNFRIQAGDYFTVAPTSMRLLNKNRLLLFGAEGRKLVWQLPKVTQPHPMTEVYRAQTLELQVGEQIRFRRNFHKDNITNGQTALISDIGAKTITFKTENGVLTLAQTHPALKHLDYAYSATNFTAQGQGCFEVIALSESFGALTTAQSFLVQISRAGYYCTLVTDDKERLIQQLSFNSGEKTSALEAASETQVAQVRVEHQLQTAFAQVLAQKCEESKTLRQCRLRVQDYAQQNRPKQQDALAHAILKDFSLHRPYLQETDIDFKSLREAGLRQQRQQLLVTSTPLIRQSYHQVGRYRRLVQMSAQCFSDIQRQTEVDQRALAYAKFSPLLKARDHLALTFIKNPLVYEAALTHYSIGQANTLGYEARQHARLHEYAQARWQKCETQAKRAQDRHYLQIYLDSKSIQQRQVMANHMVEHAKGFHPFVVEQKRSVSQVWQQIRGEAKVYRRDQIFTSLESKQQHDWLQVEKLVQARKQIALEMKNINIIKAVNANVVTDAGNTKNAQNAARLQLPKDSQQRLQGALKLRDDSVEQITKRSDDFKAALKFYHLDEDKLQTAFNSLACRARVAAFKDGEHTLPARLKLAAEMVEYKKTHASALKAANIPWKTIYRYAELAGKQMVLGEVTVPEREDILLVGCYRVCQRQVAYLWRSLNEGRIKNQQKLETAFQLTGERDRLAATIAQDLPRYQVGMQATNTRGGRLFEHAQKHCQRVALIGNWQSERQALLSEFEQLSLKNTAKVQAWLRQWQGIVSQGQRFALSIYQGAHETLNIKGRQKQEDRTLAQSVHSLLPKSLQPQTKLPTPRFKIAQKQWDVTQINQGLSYQLEDLVRVLKGDVKVRQQGDQMRLGNKGSLAINISGHYRGTWTDFESGEKGNLIGLIQRERGLNFKGALEFGLDFLHWDKATLTREVQIYRPAQSQLAKGFTSAQMKKINYAQKLATQSQPIEGTLAERYLREHRAIEGGLPDNLRYHRSVREPETRQYRPALLALSVDKNNQVQSVQVTYLDPITVNKMTGIEVDKRSYGPPKGSMSQIQQGLGKTAALAEGVETALSVASAKPNWDVYVSFGVARMAELAEHTKADNIVLCADNDGDGAASTQAITKVANQLVLQDKMVSIARPEQVGSDFNDVLQNRGVKAVCQQLDKAEIYDQSKLLVSLIPNSETLSPEIIEKTQIHLETQLKQYQNLQAELKTLKIDEILKDVEKSLMREQRPNVEYER